MTERRITRVKVPLVAKIEYNNLVISGDILELSLKGMLIKTYAKISVNQQVRVEARYLEKVFRLIATVIYENDSGFGFKINEIDLPSFLQLRELIASKVTNPDDLIQETFIVSNIIGG
jgi:PilZ domain